MMPDIYRAGGDKSWNMSSSAEPYQPSIILTITEELIELAVELDARECSGNIVHQEYEGTTWKELCDRGIEILTKLRSGEYE